MGEAAHLCLTCKLAEWQKTIAGRLHPSGDGKCGWKPPFIPISAAFRWTPWSNARNQPETFGGGYIGRRAPKPITECETYEAMK